MGFFNKLIDAAKEIDKIAGGQTGLSDFADEAAKRLNGTNEKSNINYVDTNSNTIRYDVIKIDSYTTRSSIFFGEKGKYIQTAELPLNFVAMGNGGAGEIDESYALMINGIQEDELDLDKPYITISSEFDSKIQEFKNTSTIASAIMCEKLNNSRFLFRAKIEYFKDIVYFYGFERQEDNQLTSLAMFYKKEYVTKELEEQLMMILDHMASTYQISYTGETI